MTQEAFNNYSLANCLHVATDGEAAMNSIYQRSECADAPRPDLVLLDLNLPKKDGREVLDDVKPTKPARYSYFYADRSDVEKVVTGSYWSPRERVCHQTHQVRRLCHDDKDNR